MCLILFVDVLLNIFYIQYLTHDVNGLHFRFQDGEVHTVQQVRVIRRGGAARRAVHPAAQRGQREDLRVPVVLVRDPRHPHLHHACVPLRDHLLAAHARLHDAHALPARAPRQRRHHRAPQQDGRLVPAVHPRGEPRLGDLPGHHARVREQAEPQLPAPHPRRAGRVTSGAGVGVPHVTVVAAARPAARLSAPGHPASPCSTARMFSTSGQY